MGVYIPGQQFATQGPCPSGFHIPLRAEWITLKNIFTGLGLSLGGDFIAYFKLPPAGRRTNDSGDVAQQNSQCRYWGSEKSILNNNYATGLNINGNTISAGSSPYRAFGCSIRAFSNTSVMPDSNWNILYQGTGTAGIYHNSSLGLISASSDGTTWATIADKNLGATEVYNYLDNLSESNCGGYFQWGNNYMFPFSGSVTTSSTKVDTTNYGPNNYYNSSTFITSSTSPRNWSSVRNANLWGGEDGNVNVLRMEELKNAYIGELLPASITLDKSSISLTTIGQTEQLTATVEPEDAPRKTVTWSSDDTSIATVSSSGLVTCVTPGSCTITATTVNGLTATCSVGQGWQPTANTLWYINMNQSDAVFTDTQGHTVTNNGIVYNANGVSEGCGYNNSDGKRLYSDFNTGESFPSQFTIMCFMKPTGNHYTSDHPMGISIANVSTKVTWGIGFNQNNTQVQFSYLREAIAWNTQNYSYSPLNAWHHYALTYNGTTMLGYIDGVQVISKTATGSGSGTGPNGGLTVFGRNHPSYTNTIQGYVDEAIFEDKVWTAQEIQDYLALYSY